MTLNRIAVIGSILIFLMFFWGTTIRETEMLSSPLATEAPSRSAPSASEAKSANLTEPIQVNKEPLVIFGSIPYWDQDRAVADFKQHTSSFDIISLFWYRLDSEGSIRKYQYAKEDQSLITYAQDNNVKVLALIANLPDNGDWDSDRVGLVISTAEARAAHIKEIMDLVETKGFDGINIDYEFLRDSQMEDFSAFIKELAGALHAEDKILAVAIHAQSPGGATRGQDMRALQVADILAYMTYDEHWETSKAGPVASLPWVEKVLMHARSLGVDEKKIYIGLPLYGYDWADGQRADGREYDDIVRIANREGTEVRFDATAASPMLSYTDSEGTERELWFENAQSFEAKLNLARESGLGGVHLWRLGREDVRIYDVLSRE